MNISSQLGEMPSNNCPLSLLIVVSKICEKVALRQFTTFLSQNKCLTSHQSVNRKYHSSETLNILVSDIILEAMDHKSATALILLDLSKAFDSIHHPTLLNKLIYIGASPEVVKWLKATWRVGHNLFKLVRLFRHLSTSLAGFHRVLFYLHSCLASM